MRSTEGSGQAPKAAATGEGFSLYNAGRALVIVTSRLRAKNDLVRWHQHNGVDADSALFQCPCQTDGICLLFSMKMAPTSPLDSDTPHVGDFPKIPHSRKSYQFPNIYLYLYYLYYLYFYIIHI